MNRKKIIIIAFSLILAICAGVGCFHFFTYRYYSPEAKTVKQLLAGLKTNIAEYGSKGYEVSFRQEYEIEAKSESDTESSDLIVYYEGEGCVKLSYRLDSSENGEARMTDLFASDNGYFTGIQKEKYKCYNKEDHENDEDDRLDDIEYAIEHEFTVKTDGKDLLTASDSKYTDFKDGTNSFDDSFSGKIDKQALLGSVSEETVAKAMTRLLFMDAWEYIQQFGELSEKYLSDLDFSNAKAVNDFIREKEIAIDDRGDTVFVSFVLDSAEIVADITEKDSDHLPKIYGSMELEKETGNVLHFEYNFGQYLLDALMKAGEDKPYYKVDVKDFTVDGRFLNTGLEDLTLDRSFVEYTDENKADFIVAFLKHMIPFYEEEG